jgi:hypothetical protein
MMQAGIARIAAVSPRQDCYAPIDGCNIFGSEGDFATVNKRRYKNYAAETGTSYQYFFDSRRRVVRPEGQGSGSDFTFVVTADQSAPFILRIFLSDRALALWREAHGRELDSNEQYAAAKMRLFRAFDEVEDLRPEALNLLVDQSNIEDLLGPLGLS